MTVEFGIHDPDGNELSTEWVAGRAEAIRRLAQSTRGTTLRTVCVERVGGVGRVVFEES